MKSTSSIWTDSEINIRHFHNCKCLSSRLKPDAAKVTMDIEKEQESKSCLEEG